MTTLSSLSYFIVNNMIHLTILSTFYGLGCIMIFPMSTIIATDIIPEDRRGLMLGTFDALKDLGLAIGLVLNWLTLKLTGFPIVTSFFMMTLITGLAIKFLIFFLNDIL